MFNRNTALPVRPLGRPSVKPVSVCAQKLCARSIGCPDTREDHDRRKLHLDRQTGPGAPWKSGAALQRPSHLGKVTTDDSPKTGDRSVYSKPPDSTGRSKSLPVCHTQAGKRADIVSLRKHLAQARRLASAIKQGQSYFHLLQKEEQEERQRRRREEQLRMEPQPPFSSDLDSYSEGWLMPAGSSWPGGSDARCWRKKIQSARPFTPVHHSLTSPLLSEAPREVIYRQLCCLNWLLEALTLDRSGRVGPLTACWDPKDPGRGRTTIRTLKKERAIENKWEQFVSTKPQRAHPRRPPSSSAALHTWRRSSFMSVASFSGLTSTTVGSSLSSLVPGLEEDMAAVETDQRPSECLRTLADVQQWIKKEHQSSQTSSVTDGLKAPESRAQPLPQRTENQTGSKTAATSQPKSCPAEPPSTISHLNDSKVSMLQELRAAFEERAEEVAERYISVLELKAREWLNSSLQRYQASRHMTGSLHPPVTCKSQEEEAPNSSSKNKHNMWLSTLLSSLPEEVRKEQAVSRVLKKLSGFAEQQTIRVRPQLFLKVLGGLEAWELCLPELCVAIQVVIEHVVQMSREEYDAWLFSRVTVPPQYHGAPHTPGEPHSGRPVQKAEGSDK